jgi:hypothetical protein
MPPLSALSRLSTVEGTCRTPPRQPAVPRFLQVRAGSCWIDQRRAFPSFPSFSSFSASNARTVPTATTTQLRTTARREAR